MLVTRYPPGTPHVELDWRGPGMYAAVTWAGVTYIDSYAHELGQGYGPRYYAETIEQALAEHNRR